MKIIVVTSKFLPSNLMNYCKDKNIRTIRLNQDVKSIEPKWMLLYRLFIDSFKSLSHLKKLRSAETILSISYITIPLLIFRKVGLLKRSTSFIWEGFFLHNQKFFPVFNFLFSHLFHKTDSLIVYSFFEKELYSKGFKLNHLNIHYVPLVFAPDKNTAVRSEYTKKAEWEKLPSKFYFSGGYSHRDYPTLIETFRNINANLVICSSRLNDELINLDIPKNVILLNDVSREDFAELIKRSEACLLLIKSNSGAAGQLFALEAMYYEKIIIASSTSILEELIVHRQNGFVVHNPISEIPSIIQEIEDMTTDLGLIKEKAKKRILENNSEKNYNIHLDIALKSAANYSLVI